jgi:hypothetical protein
MRRAVGKDGHSTGKSVTWDPNIEFTNTGLGNPVDQKQAKILAFVIPLLGP